MRRRRRARRRAEPGQRGPRERDAPMSADTSSTTPAPRVEPAPNEQQPTKPSPEQAAQEVGRQAASGEAATTHARLLAWVTEVAAPPQPDVIHWCDGSDEEWKTLTDELVEAGTFTRLTKKPNS